jgi:ribosomal protein S18 acetylase RimI-like enzyme
MTTASRSSAIEIRRGSVQDAALFSTLAATTFVDTFGADNTPEDIALYSAQAFREEIQRRELADPRVCVLFAEREGETVGYTMLRDGGLDGADAEGESIEIVRLYATRRAIGQGVGAALMQACLDEAAARGRDTIWLGVWEHNPRAIAFYRKWGFADVGSKTFVLGCDHQTDRVMMRPVTAGEDEGERCGTP